MTEAWTGGGAEGGEPGESNPRCYCCNQPLTLTRRLTPHPFADKGAGEEVTVESWDCTNLKCYANPRLKIPVPPMTK
jgi:hypothetical protein